MEIEMNKPKTALDAIRQTSHLHHEPRGPSSQPVAEGVEPAVCRVCQHEEPDQRGEAALAGLEISPPGSSENILFPNGGQFFYEGNLIQGIRLDDHLTGRGLGEARHFQGYRNGGPFMGNAGASLEHSDEQCRPKSCPQLETEGTARVREEAQCNTSGSRGGGREGAETSPPMCISNDSFGTNSVRLSSLGNEHQPNGFNYSGKENPIRLSSPAGEVGPSIPECPVSKSPLMQLGCACKNELSLVHYACAIRWFFGRGTTTCEVCGHVATSIRLLDIHTITAAVQERRRIFAAHLLTGPHQLAAWASVVDISNPSLSLRPEAHTSTTSMASLNSRALHPVVGGGNYVAESSLRAGGSDPSLTAGVLTSGTPVGIPVREREEGLVLEAGMELAEGTAERRVGLGTVQEADVILTIVSINSEISRGREEGPSPTQSEGWVDSPGRLQECIMEAEIRKQREELMAAAEWFDLEWPMPAVQHLQGVLEGGDRGRVNSFLQPEVELYPVSTGTKRFLEVSMTVLITALLTFLFSRLFAPIFGQRLSRFGLDFLAGGVVAIIAVLWFRTIVLPRILRFLWVL